ncbi:hypothetical protein GCM10022395_26070 [Snuella lapsa]|uniref:TonB C-terminal domain-containing protein n=2 Tax=Snuella lapsa TaxID=870481 RepID=A0ABP6Y1Q7_9FLAO
MTPKEKGRFCDSCSKTVIDFTKMDVFKIQNFIAEHQGQRICGHFKQTQLDSINLFIPSKVIATQHKFHKLFLLALLITMGTTLFNCTNKNGTKQKIDSIEIIDNISNHPENRMQELSTIDKTDTKPLPKCSKADFKTPHKKEVLETVVDGELDIVEVLGNIEIVDPVGIIEYEEEEDIVLGFITVDVPPEFKNTPKNLNTEEKRKYFSDQITKAVSKNFTTTQGHLGLSGKQKIFVQFKIDEKGNVTDVRARAPHSKLEKEAKRVINLLPQFIPAKQRNKPTTIVYNLPIIFQIEEQ